MNNATDEHVDKRVYLGGLAPSVTIEDLKTRFQSFGAVDSLNLPIATGKGHIFFWLR